MYTVDVVASTPETHVQLMLKEIKDEINVWPSEKMWNLGNQMFS